jgi:hypothetical protein
MAGIGGSLGLCALCGENFLVEIIMGTTIKELQVDGCAQQLYAHQVCAVKYAGKQWHDLPPSSPLRQACEKDNPTLVKKG